MGIQRKATLVGAAAAALLLGTSLLAQAQLAPPPVDDRLVSENEATHIANLAATGGTAGTATAWFWADPQNNTLRWTIEFNRVGVTGADIACPVAKVGPAPADAPAAVVPIRVMTAAIETVPAAGPPAAGTPAAPGAEGAGVAAGDPAGRGVGVGLREVLDLFEGVPPAVNLQSPFEGEAANLDAPIFEEIEAGGCFLNIEISTIAAPPAGAGGG